jgi:hypothetical protein
MKQKAIDFWGVWVGAWIGLDLAPGAETETEGAIPMPDGSVLRTPARIRRAPDDPARPDLIELSAESTLAGEGARKAFARAMGAILERLPERKDKFAADAIEEFSRSTKASAVVDPRTLVPARAKLEIAVTIALKGMGKRTDTERREYVFDWSGGKSPVKK